MFALVTALHKGSNPGFADTFMPLKYVCKRNLASFILCTFMVRHIVSEAILSINYNECKRVKWTEILLNNTRIIVAIMRHFYQSISVTKASNKG